MNKSTKTFTEKTTAEFQKKKDRNWNAPKIILRKRPKRKLPPKTTKGFK
tara:strand:+ start:2741 stop:2887 length:147 start_codon:yes stop_codon:yes gene_type:complete